MDIHRLNLSVGEFVSKHLLNGFLGFQLLSHSVDILLKFVVDLTFMIMSSFSIFSLLNSRLLLLLRSSRSQRSFDVINTAFDFFLLESL